MERASSRPAEQVAAAHRRGIQRGRVATVAGFLLPAAVIYTWLVLLPVAQAIYYSFYRWNGLGPLQNFTGLANYVRAFGDKIFVGALSHNFQIIIMSLAIQLPLA